MTEATKLPIKTEKGARVMAPAQRTHIECIRREIDRVFDRFHLGTFPLRPPGVRANCPGANAVPDEVYFAGTKMISPAEHQFVVEIEPENAIG